MWRTKDTTVSDFAKGLAPASGGGTTNFLRADGTWAAPSGGGGGEPSDGDKGDITVTGSGLTWTIDPDVVTNSKLANMSLGTFKGRQAISGGDPQDLTSAQATEQLDLFTSSLRGLAPPSGGGTVNFLRADGGWINPFLLTEEATPAAPAAGQLRIFADSSASALLQRNDAGVVHGHRVRASIAAQAGFDSDTYVTRSGLIIPSISMQAGMFWEWKILVSKTAAGTAAPVYQIRIGTAQTTVDTSRLSLTGPPQTADADNGLITILVTCRSVGASGVIYGMVYIDHNRTTTGLANLVHGVTHEASAGFDNAALGGNFIGLSINAGASAAWTIEQVTGRIYYG